MGSVWNLPERMRGYDWLCAEVDLIPEHDWKLWEHFPIGAIGRPLTFRHNAR